MHPYMSNAPTTNYCTFYTIQDNNYNTTFTCSHSALLRQQLLLAYCQYFCASLGQHCLCIYYIMYLYMYLHMYIYTNLLQRFFKFKLQAQGGNTAAGGRALGCHCKCSASKCNESHIRTIKMYTKYACIHIYLKIYTFVNNKLRIDGVQLL